VTLCVGDVGKAGVAGIAEFSDDERIVDLTSNKYNHTKCRNLTYVVLLEELLGFPLLSM
jgi:hypothetical protein